MTTLTFLNHASFCIESDSSILLVDPWLQGFAFHSGWALLDNSTSNQEVLERVGTSTKRLFVWYSHEHSDHFAVPFIKQLKQVRPDTTFVFQATLDKRVSAFLRKEGYAVIESPAGKPCIIDQALSITTWPYPGGDSFSLIKAGTVSILNVNDCAIRNLAEAQAVKRKVDAHTRKIDLLFTQFGYANWIGNEDAKRERRAAAQEKFDRIHIQDQVMQPACIVPFASFVYFCHPENFYMNDEQNQPASVRSSTILAGVQHKISFMRPRDSLQLDGGRPLAAQLEEYSPAAEMHWNGLLASAQPISTNDDALPIQDVVAAFNIYRRRLSLNFAFTLQMREIIGRIKPVAIRLNDVDQVVRLSYLKGIKVLPAQSTWDMSLSTNVFQFMLQNEYGFNTTRVNGRFRIGQADSMPKVIAFFAPQDRYRQGFGMQNPVATVVRFFKRSGRKIWRTIFSA